MLKKIKKTVLEILGRIGITIIHSSTLGTFVEESEYSMRYKILERVGGTSTNKITIGEAAEIFSQSKSQLGQDIFALAASNLKRGGYFVEFGATNGISLSNTWLLEKKFGWTGLLAEPARVWHRDLTAARNAQISFSCIWKTTGERLEFSESAELSTITRFASLDGHKKARKTSKKYLVETVSLLDFLDFHNAPRSIDFLSIDTEGSEYEILSSFDFSKYEFGSITVEHNNTSQREKIFNLLTSKGYKRFDSLDTKFDDWYLKA